MTHHDQIRALMPELISGKTHEQLLEEMKARDESRGVHYVNGVKLPWIIPRSNLDAIKTFKVRYDDVFVVTYPRSGTHWTAEILQLILSDGSDAIDRSRISTGLEATMAPDEASLEKTTPGYRIYEAAKSPRVILTHCRESLLPLQVWTKPAKVVYVARNPKDMLVSFYGLTKFAERMSIPSFDELLLLFYLDEMIFGSWFDHVLDYWRHKDDVNVCFLKYEDMHSDLRGSVCKLAKHIGKDLSDDVIDGITERVTLGGMQKTYKKLEGIHGEDAKQMTNLFGKKSSPFLRKGKVGDWKNTFTVAQNALFDKVYALKMQGTDLEFDFGL